MKIGVIGLGYVGLPVAVAFAKKFDGTIGFDVNVSRVEELKNGFDSCREVSEAALQQSNLFITSELKDLSNVDFFIVAVPTPVDENHTPDLTPLQAASVTVGKVLKKGAIVVYESTVYPGVTEDFCGPILERTSGLTCGEDFTLGYSPERINPGDTEHTLENIVKVVSGQDDECLKTIAETYSTIIKAGVHKAPSIRVAEAAKVIENTQRDLNIALMNELSLIFDMMGIRTKDVLAAASTKWNFLKFFPGLVGGHCIGVDPYYLTTAAERLGYHPEVILAGRRINDSMGRYVAQRAMKIMVKKEIPVSQAQVGVFGITFKENIPDTRNSRVPDIVHELADFGCSPLVFDPHANPKEIEEEYKISLSPLDSTGMLDVVILAVAHDALIGDKGEFLSKYLKPDGILIDVKSVFHPSELQPEQTYWSL
ncbi:MAG: nucleotide sugar dehydrogenase [Bdellovibrionales bacterium]|nr:nucleotide sugar dehydrogenase [Bdellovibrionales bacterium]